MAGAPYCIRRGGRCSVWAAEVQRKDVFGCGFRGIPRPLRPAAWWRSGRCVPCAVVVCAARPAALSGVSDDGRSLQRCRDGLSWPELWDRPVARTVLAWHDVAGVYPLLRAAHFPGRPTAGRVGSVALSQSSGVLW